MRFEGCYTALVTPFKGGELDEAALRKVVRFQLRGGVVLSPAARPARRLPFPWRNRSAWCG